MAEAEAPVDLSSSPSASEDCKSLRLPPNDTVGAIEFAASEPSSSLLSSSPSESAGASTCLDSEGASQPSEISAERDASSLEADESLVVSDSSTMYDIKESDAYSTRTDSSKPNLDTLARGISSVMGPVMKSFDYGVEGALKSQSILASSVDRLTRELDKLLEDTPLPFTMQHATKLSNVRSRISSLDGSLRIIQKRMENIERLIAGYAAKRKHGKDFVEETKPTSQSLITSGMHLASDVYENDESLRRLFSEDETNGNVTGNSVSSESQVLCEKHVPDHDKFSFETKNPNLIVVDAGMLTQCHSRNETEITLENANSVEMINDVKTDEFCSTERNEH